MLGTGRVGLQLPPQLSDVDPEVLCLVQIVWSPNLVQQLTLGYDLSRVLDQHLQQPILVGRQMNVITGDFDGALFQIDFDSPESHNGAVGRGCSGAPQRGTNARKQFSDAEGLG